MKVTIIRRVKWVGHKWKLVSANQYIVWRPRDWREAWKTPESFYELDLTKKQR